MNVNKDLGLECLGNACGPAASSAFGSSLIQQEKSSKQAIDDGWHAMKISDF
jgi:hypothetical protein